MKIGLPSCGNPIFFILKILNTILKHPGGLSRAKALKRILHKNFYFILCILPIAVLKSICYTIIVPREWARR